MGKKSKKGASRAGQARPGKGKGKTKTARPVVIRDTGSPQDNPTVDAVHNKLAQANVAVSTTTPSAQNYEEENRHKNVPESEQTKTFLKRVLSDPADSPLSTVQPKYEDHSIDMAHHSASETKKSLEPHVFQSNDKQGIVCLDQPAPAESKLKQKDCACHIM